MAIEMILDQWSSARFDNIVQGRYNLSAQSGIAAGITAISLWLTGLCIYRLYFSPLAKFPGDKLAAISGWVETYHDVFRGGQLVFKLAEWHEKYGPVVRINPWEVHIADPDFAEVLYATNSQFEKKKEWKYRFGIPHSTFDTIEHHHHRVRRAALAPFFSKQKIVGITGFISEKAQRLCDRLEKEFKGKHSPAVLSNCFTAFTFDVVTYYTFARSFEYMEYPDFNGPFTNAAKVLAMTLHTMGHFPWLLKLLQSLPKSLSNAMDPNTAAVFAFHKEIEDQIRAIKLGNNDAHKSLSHKTVFNELLNSNLPADEKTVERLRHEGGSVVAGGVETTATALSKASFYILNDAEIKHKLVTELRSAMPDPHATPTLAALEALPYLSAVVTETLRMTIGISSRTIRKSPVAPVAYKDRFVIPPGAYFSMTTYYTHIDPSIWESPHDFRPERWLDDTHGGKPTARNGEPLSKYLVPFGRGPRMCVGMNLARAELFIGLAVVFRRCELSLYQTTLEAVTMKADYFIPLTDANNKGVQVLLR